MASVNSAPRRGSSRPPFHGLQSSHGLSIAGDCVVLGHRDDDLRPDAGHRGKVEIHAERDPGGEAQGRMSGTGAPGRCPDGTGIDDLL